VNSRERVRAAINHREPDRVPVDLGATAATGIVANAYARLRAAYGLATDRVRVYDVFGMMASVDADLCERVGADTALVPSLCPRFGIPIDTWKPWRLLDGTPVEVPAGFHAEPDANGDLLLIVDGAAVGKMPKEGFYFSEIANSTMGGLDTLSEPPDPAAVSFPLLTDEDLRFREQVARDLHEGTERAVIVDLVDNIRWNTSIPNWLYAFAAAPERTFDLHAKKTEALIEKVNQLAQAVGDRAEVFAIYQDFGTQQGELISPAAFERLVAPHYRRLFAWIHEHTAWKVFFHSCGSIYRLIPHMIAMGVDILNPVQSSTARMDPTRLKAEFGDRLVFWGGGVETQTVLPFGTPDDVRRQVHERVRILGPAGGFVFAPTQDIQADVPVENLLAMYDAVRECGAYPFQDMEEEP
jgi:hypothetical protein